MTEQIVVRFPADLLALVKADADEHGRTVAQSVRFYVRQALGASTKGEEK